MDEKMVREFGEATMGVCNILGLLRTLSEAAYSFPEESPRMDHMANALEAAADLLEHYYMKLDAVESVLSCRGDERLGNT